MLQYATYSVISPEGCASILWKSAERAPDAARAMGITSQRLHELGLVDQVVGEPLGGAHRDPEWMAASLKKRLLETLDRLTEQPPEQLLERRYRRLIGYGAFEA
jgi:acetyl-CoA carboxylase carboxyl transferase subunit alpha